NELRSFEMSYQLQLRWFTGLPWWGRLTSLSLDTPEDDLAVLRDNLPGSLGELSLQLGVSGAEIGDADSFAQLVHSFFAQPARRPPRRLRLNGFLIPFPIPPAALGRLLEESARCELQSLALIRCDLTADHARVIADSPRSGRLLALDIGDFSPEVARILFASEHLRSVVSLNLAGGWGRAGVVGA